MDGSDADTELVPSEHAFPINGLAIANIPIAGNSVSSMARPNFPQASMPNLPPNTNVTLQRVNQYGAADTELARLQFARQINTISLNTGTPIAIVEQLAETAHRTRVEEVEATMNSHSNEIRRIEVDAARTTSNYEARCISEMSELRQDQVASRNEMGNHEHMVGQHYQVVAGRDQAIQQLRTELAVSQSQLQS